jgi:hypothetical protein
MAISSPIAIIFTNGFHLCITSLVVHKIPQFGSKKLKKMKKWQKAFAFFSHIKAL